jgi:hypothetical protein
MKCIDLQYAGLSFSVEVVEASRADLLLYPNGEGNPRKEHGS